MSALLPSAVALSLVAVLAAALTRRHPGRNALASRLRSAGQALAVTAGIQAVHFAEELTTGFHVEFPALFGLAPIPLDIFVGFNLAWLAIWSLCVAWIRTGGSAPLFAAWFLAVAAVVNGIAHPMLAVATGGYFPGLLTAPFIGVAGIWLWRRLLSLAG